ncbi:MAG: biotin/lipoyl-binding protein, partial [Candidatus Rokubacteria bacterium]|nr:biotin/lipoyl-binding protein [Candidatus Rokubacteria bacterium]
MRRLIGGLVLVSAAALASAGCSDRAGGAPPAAAPAAVPVGVATVERKMVPLQVVTVGNVQAYTTVGVKSQIAGQITKVHFTEGREVKRGDLLFTLDPRPFEASLRQNEANVAKDVAQRQQAEAALRQRGAEVTQALANLERDLAQMENARVQEERYRDLVKKEFIAREQYDQVRTNFAALQAVVQASRAAVENARASARAAEAAVENAQAAIKGNEAMVESARLQLAYTAIRAPMDGRTGNLLAQVGNVVKSGEDAPLVVVVQVQPIYVSFSVPEQQLTAINSYRARGTLTVEARIDGGRRTAAGTLTFVNNTVDPTTGTIQLKATFP